MATLRHLRSAWGQQIWCRSYRRSVSVRTGSWRHLNPSPAFRTLLGSRHKLGSWVYGYRNSSFSIYLQVETKVLIILMLIILKQKLNRDSEDQNALCEGSAETFAHSYGRSLSRNWKQVFQTSFQGFKSHTLPLNIILSNGLKKKRKKAKHCWLHELKDLKGFFYSIWVCANSRSCFFLCGK